MSPPLPHRSRVGVFVLVLGTVLAAAALVTALLRPPSAPSGSTRTANVVPPANFTQTSQSREFARMIVDKVKAHMDIDTSATPTVAEIVDVQKLREHNDFYDKAENGDYLIITRTRAVLYSEARDVILDVIPIQMEQVGGQAGQGPTLIPSATEEHTQTRTQVVTDGGVMEE